MGSAEFGNGIRNAQRQVAASVLNARAAAVAMDFVDTDKTPYDTGTFASTGTSVATLGVQRAAEALRESLLDLASQITGVPVEQCRLDDGQVRCGDGRCHCNNCTTPPRFGTSSTCRAKCTGRRVPRLFWPTAFASPCIA